MSDCKNFAEKHETVVPEAVPYVVYEMEQARAERHYKRIWIALIVAVALIFVSNAVWLYAWMQYDYESYEITDDGDSNANYIGQDGNIYNNGSENKGEETHTEEQLIEGEENP